MCSTYRCLFLSSFIQEWNVIKTTTRYSHSYRNEWTEKQGHREMIQKTWMPGTSRPAWWEWDWVGWLWDTVWQNLLRLSISSCTIRKIPFQTKHQAKARRSTETHTTQCSPICHKEITCMLPAVLPNDKLWLGDSGLPWSKERYPTVSE